MFRTHILCILIALCVLHYTNAKVGFMKDQSMDAKFPPIAQRSDAGIPEGHLRPLGWQRKPDGKVAEEKNVPEPKEFYTKYIKENKPVVFRAATKDAPAIKKWDADDKYLNKNYGALDVSVTLKKEALKGNSKKMKFSKFLREYKYEDWYLSTTVPREMTNELLLPSCLSCGTPTRYFQESELWMSSGGTASLLHHHADHNLHCVLAGRKDFILIDKSHKNKFDVVEKSEHAGSGHSKLDMDMINVFKYKEISKVPWTYSTLRTGDCIYVPANYMHQVRSYGRSISSTVLWAPTPDFDTEDCSKNKLVKLSDASFIWAYSDGAKQLSNAKLNAESLRHKLFALLRNDDSLHYERFAPFYDDVMSESDEHPSSSETFKIFTEENTLTRQQIQDMESSRLLQVAAILNKARHAHSHDEL